MLTKQKAWDASIDSDDWRTASRHFAASIERLQHLHLIISQVECFSILWDHLMHADDSTLAALDQDN